MEESEVVSAALRSGRTADWNLMLIHGSYGAFSLLLTSFPHFFVFLLMGCFPSCLVSFVGGWYIRFYGLAFLFFLFFYVLV